MSENYRKDVDEYSEHCMPHMDGKTKKVYRPHSMRQVSAVKELNRLRGKLDSFAELEIQLRTNPMGGAVNPVRCQVADTIKEILR